MHKTHKPAGSPRQNRRLGWLLLTPALLAFGVSYLLPFAMALVRSFFRGMGGEFAGLENYADLLRNQTFLLALRNLVLLWCFVLPLNLLAGFVAALLCHRAHWQKHRFLFFLPAVLPAAATVSIVYDWLGRFPAEGWLSGGQTARWPALCLLCWSCGKGWDIPFWSSPRRCPPSRWSIHRPPRWKALRSAPFCAISTCRCCAPPLP